jgi:hypothetical protein
MVSSAQDIESMSVQVISRPRRRGRENTPSEINLTLEILSKNFHRPVAKVAEEYGIGCTAFKHACRKLGLMQWPYRKLKMANSIAEQMANKKKRFEKSTTTIDRSIQKKRKKGGSVDEECCVVSNGTPNPIFHTPILHEMTMDPVLMIPQSEQETNDFMESLFLDECSVESSKEDDNCTEEEVPDSSSFMDFWDTGDNHTDIPGSAELHPFVDPFHDDWFMNAT